MKCSVLVAVIMLLAIVDCAADEASRGIARLEPASQRVLRIPQLVPGRPVAGRRVKVVPPEYVGTEVFHTVYLPTNWQPDGPRLPIIFEYTGNYFPRSGSSGEPEDAGLGYCLSGGKFIWVSLPYVNAQHDDNAVTWWGDEDATVAYAKQNVPRIIKDFRAHPQAVILCGFSRGAIGVNYIGLHDDEVAKLWTAFVSHDHFDGIRAWGRTKWGTPLDKYRREALVRLQRVGKRPYLVSQNGRGYGTEEYLVDALPQVGNFTFHYISAGEIFGNFPNAHAKTAHTDVWAIKPSKYRTQAWQWMNRVTAEAMQTP